MKYFALFQNGNRKEYAKSAPNTCFISSTIQMYISLDHLMDKVMQAVDNQGEDFTWLDTAFVDLCNEIKKFDPKGKDNAINLKEFVKALAEQCPNTFPKYECGDPVVFMERWNMLINMQPDEKNLMKSHIKYTDSDPKSYDVVPQFGPNDLITQYFGIGLVFSQNHDDTAESLIMTTKNIVSIPVDGIVSVLERRLDDSDESLSMSQDYKLNGQLFKLAN
jgi:hypothetical protein